MKFRWMRFSLWVLLCTCCLQVGASGAEESAVTGEKAAKEARELEQTREITEGSFRALRIGASKQQVLVALREMGVMTVMPGFGEQVPVKSTKDLSRLQDAKGIIIGAGDVIITFDENDVERVAVAPIHPEWNTLLGGIRTRQEAFRALAHILEQSKRVEVRALAADAKHVGVDRITPETQSLLEKYDYWSVPYDEQGGYVHMGLSFAEGTLQRISVLELPGPL